MIKCTQDASDWIAGNVDEASKIIGKHFKIPVDNVKQMVVVQNFDVTYNAPFRKAMDELNGFMMSKGKSKKKVNWATNFDSRGLGSVSASLVK
jgi:hypothetical protein